MANRKKQRTVTRDPVRTRALILEKATAIFAGAGYEGASINDIVDATGINKRMIYHYFGDKRGLYRTAHLQQWMELKDWLDRSVRDRLLSTAFGGLDTGGLLLEVLGILHDFMANHQAFIRLMMWDGLEGGGIARDLWSEVRGPLFTQMRFILQQAQREGRLDPALDPTHLIISFLGVSGFHFAYATSLGDLIDKDPLSPEALAERRQQVLGLLAALIRSPQIS
jgi:TetR/AcrR family transcriptional regulator